MRALRKKIQGELYGSYSASRDTALLDAIDEPEHWPEPIVHTERRMQLLTYQAWSDLVAEDDFPTLTEFLQNIDPALALRSALFKFTESKRDPVIAFVGDKLAAECGISAHGHRQITDIPKRSLLAQIAQYYLHEISYPTPLGFEAELVNQRERTIVYRGILLPFSQYGVTTDLVLVVIGWKEVADPETTDDLLHELALAMESPAAEMHNERTDDDEGGRDALEMARTARGFGLAVFGEVIERTARRLLG